MDAPLHPHDLVRPWRTATVVASLVAAVELVLLIVAAFLLLAKPLAHAMQQRAKAAVFAPVVTHRPKPVVHARAAAARPTLSRSHTGILVLNGNGQAGAAGRAAATLRGLGYRIRGVANAQRQDYATTVVMYRAGYRPEAVRLAHDLHTQVVGPLDGLRPAALHGGQLAVVLGVG